MTYLTRKYLNKPDPDVADVFGVHLLQLIELAKVNASKGQLESTYWTRGGLVTIKCVASCKPGVFRAVLYLDHDRVSRLELLHHLNDSGQNDAPLN